MSTEKRGGRPGSEGEVAAKSTTSSRARNRTVMLTPEMTGQVRALLYHEEGRNDQEAEAAVSEMLKPDAVNDLLPSGGGWSRPDRPETPTSGGFNGPQIPDFGPVPTGQPEQSSLNTGQGFSSGFEGGGFSAPGNAAPRTGSGAFGAPQFQGGAFQGSAGLGTRGGFGTGLPVPEPVSNASRRDSGSTKRFITESAPPLPEVASSLASKPLEPRRMSSGRVIGFLVSFDSDENGECFDVRSGRLLITCRPTDQGDFILIDHPSVSPLHAIIRATKEGKVEVLDQLSEYGTGIIRSGQDEEIEVAGARTVIQHGDIIRFGERRFVVCLVPAVALGSAKKNDTKLGAGHEESVSE